MTRQKRKFCVAFTLGIAVGIILILVSHNLCSGVVVVHHIPVVDWLKCMRNTEYRPIQMIVASFMRFNNRVL